MEFNLEIQSSLLHAVIGAAIGYASAQLASNLVVLAMMVVVLLAMQHVTGFVFKLKEKITEKEPYDKKWWMANGVYPYIVFWFFTWILFYNL